MFDWEIPDISGTDDYEEAMEKFAGFLPSLPHIEQPADYFNDDDLEKLKNALMGFSLTLSIQSATADLVGGNQIEDFMTTLMIVWYWAFKEGMDYEPTQDNE